MNFPGTVLVVDDEPHIRKYVSLILTSIGVTSIIEAANGEDAVGLYETGKPDLVLLDVNMPRIDGVETLKRLKAVDPEAVVIMLTSLANRQTIEQALELGAVNYIRKDTPREEIARSLTETIQSCFEPGEPGTP